MKGLLQLSNGFFFLLCKSLTFDHFKELYPFPPLTLDVNILLFVFIIFIYPSLMFVHMMPSIFNMFLFVHLRNYLFENFNIPIQFGFS